MMEKSRVSTCSFLFVLYSSILACMMAISPVIVHGQVHPPRPIILDVSPLQHLNFGAFAITGTNGGTVTISNSGDRTSTGDIFLVGSTYSEGIFTIEVVTGTSLYMMNGPEATLTGSNGGEMTLTLGLTFPSLPHITTFATTEFHFGGTLTVGPISSNPPGDYYGTYEIIINHE